MANEFIARNGLISQNNSVVTGSLTVTQGITGSLFGSSSYAITASYAPDYVLNSTTSSMLLPYVLSSSTSSFVVNSQTSSFVLNSSTSSFVANNQTSSMLLPYVKTSTTSSMTVATASYVLQAVSSSFATTASFALNAGSGGVSRGLVQAISVGLQNIF